MKSYKDYLPLSVEEILEKSETVHDDDYLKITSLDNGREETVLVFSYYNLDGLAREHLPLYTRSDKNIIHIVDKTNSFFNRISPEDVLSKINHLVAGKDIFLAGFSHGAYNAIYFSNFVNAKFCLAFAPVYSIQEELLGQLDSVNESIRAMRDKRSHTVSFSKDVKYCFVFGDSPGEAQSYSGIIPKYRSEGINAEHLIIKGAGHSVLDPLIFALAKDKEQQDHSGPHLRSSHIISELFMYEGVDAALAQLPSIEAVIV